MSAPTARIAAALTEPGAPTAAYLTDAALAAMVPRAIGRLMISPLAAVKARDCTTKVPQIGSLTMRPPRLGTRFAGVGASLQIQLDEMESPPSACPA